MGSDHEGRARLLAAYDRHVRECAPPDTPRCRVERVGRVVRQTSPGSGWNGVLWSDLDEHTADEAIAAQVAYFAGRGCGFEWKLYRHDRPAGLEGRLRAAGFTPEPAETVLVGRTEELAALPVEPPDGITLHAVADASGAGLLERVHTEAFGRRRPGLRELVGERLRGAPETIAAVVAMAGGVPVSAARMEMPPGSPFAGLWGGGTVPAWRGRGVYRLLVAHRARIAAARGIPYLHVDASAQSRPILERLGFHVLGTTVPYVWEPGPGTSPGTCPGPGPA
ncbi:GNAT family N-acetyltransferase [Streptomyces globosus]|uniref:GNAT family N-acetyltransferase n=1 Tax=Streptomyces globosus TaxID=68209 RepID=A0A344TWU3_9ACTN|nr:GNAT family N-acetyltransferase [Streptomyces globosus]AXE23114.1 GNAT family N-acetyltransferase [Streptomyces globosus]